MFAMLCVRGWWEPRQARVASRSALESPAVLWRRAADGSGLLRSRGDAGWVRGTDVRMYVRVRLQQMDG
jgi:hypothetical protein